MNKWKGNQVHPLKKMTKVTIIADLLINQEANEKVTRGRSPLNKKVTKLISIADLLKEQKANGKVIRGRSLLKKKGD